MEGDGSFGAGVAPAPHGRRSGLIGARRVLVLAAAGWSVLLLVAAAALVSPEHDYGVLYFASAPLVLTVVVAALLSARSGVGQRLGRIVALVLCGLVALAVMASLIAMSFVMLPPIALLVGATVRPASAYR